MSDNLDKRILFVDDDPNILTAMKRQLYRKYPVDTAEDAAQALIKIESDAPYAVIISDLRMRGMEGLEFLRQAREFNPDCVGIILTGFADLDVAVQAVNNGQVFRFLTKPCPPETLQQAIQEAVNQFANNLRLTSFSYTVHCERGQPGSIRRGRGCLAIAGYPACQLARDPSIWDHMILPEYRLQVWEETQKRFQGEQSDPFEFKILRPDGKVRWIRNTLIVHRDGQGLLSRCEGLIEDVTERRDMEEALHQTRSRYERMVANVPGLVFQCKLKSDGFLAFDFVSESCRTLFGIEPEQLREDAQLLLGRLVPDDRADLYRLLAESACTLRPVEWSGGGCFDDQKRFFRAVARPDRAPSGDILWDGLMLDMTEVRRIEEQVTELAKFPAEDPSPVLRVSAEGILLYANKASETLMSLWDVSVGQSVPAYLQELIEGVRVSGIHECIEVPCRDRTYSIEFAPVNESDYVNLYARDVTDVKRAERDLIAANEVLRKHDRLKSEFVSTVSHELRTPLCIFKNIISNALAGVMGKLSNKLIENLRMADKSVDRLSRIIGDFLDISKIESGTLQLHRSVFAIQSVIEEVVTVLQALGAAKSIRITRDLPETPIEIDADRDRIIQVLTNLVGNAIKFISVDGQIRVEVIDQVDQVEVSVHDNGPGLTQDEMTRIFDRFVQVHKISGAGEHGTGLGLAIAKTLVEMHNGRIGVDSIPGRGSRFFFLLPKQRPDSQAVAVTALDADEQDNP